MVITNNSQSSSKKRTHSQIESVSDSSSSQLQSDSTSSQQTEGGTPKVLEGGSGSHVELSNLLTELQQWQRAEICDHYEWYFSSTGSSRAKCKYFGKTYAANLVTNGTSLSTHNDKCAQYPPNKEKMSTKQKVLSYNNPIEVAVGFSQKEITKACVDMIIMDELPFSFVEGEGFKKFCLKACPKWSIPCRQTVARDVLSMYYFEKQSLKELIHGYRMCITTDTWTSLQNINYMVVTAHFIDNDWTLHKKILKFCLIPNHKGDSIGRLLEDCLIDWGIEKLLTVTMDSASSNDPGLSYLIKKVGNWPKLNALLLGGEDLHVKCIAHILNLIVGDGLNVLNTCIQSIRNVVRYARSSPSRLKLFKSCVELGRMADKGLVILDVPTRWNSTYLMLQSAIKFRRAFDRLLEDDSSYQTYFARERMIGPPVDDDWDLGDVFTSFLKPFYDITLRSCCSNTPTIHHAFMDVFKVYSLLHENECEQLSSIALSMKAKYDKYWGSMDSVNKYYFIAIVLDPRHKLEKVIDYFEIIFGDDNDKVEAHTKIVKDFLISLYSIYEKEETSIPSHPMEERHNDDSISQVSNDSSTPNMASTESERKLEEKLRLRKAKKSEIITTDVDRYLQEDPIEEVDDSKFDILSWWRVYGSSKYPVLARIAREVLAIPISTIASESCFSTSGQIINSFRSSLSPKMVEALICTQNWLLSNHVALHCEPSIEEMEFYEAIEKEIERAPMLPPKSKP